MSETASARKRWDKANTVGATGDDIRESWMDVPVLLKKVDDLQAIVDRLQTQLD